VGTVGLDNDGDDIYDGADPDCAPPPDINVTPLSLDFGSVATGNTATLTTTINNAGGSDLTVTGLAITGSLDFDFNPATPGLPITIPPGGSADVSVDYAPLDEGDDAGALEITSDDPDEGLVTVPLAGTGIPPANECAITVTLLSLDFGTLELGNSLELTTRLGNNGTTDCTVSALTLSGSTDFALGAGAPATPFTVAQGANIPVPVVYTPSDVGADNGSLDIVSDDQAQPVVTVSLSGAAVAARDINVTPASLDYGQVSFGQTASLTATIQNLGGVDLTVGALTLTGSGDFALGLSAPTPPFTVPAGGSVDVPVDYTPSGLGLDNGTLEIDSDDPDEPVVSVPLSGEGVAPAQQCDIFANKSAIDYGSVRVGSPATTNVVVGNTGDGPCVISALNVTGSTDFAVVSPTPPLPITVDPGAGKGIFVRYLPSDLGPDTGTLEIDSNDLDEPSIPIALSGTGVIEPEINVTPLGLGFGDVESGMTTSRTTTIQNIGNADLTVTGLTLTGSLDFDFGAGAPAVPFVLPQGGSVDVPLDYTTTGGGADSGTLEIASDDTDEPVVNVALTGNEIPPLVDQNIDVDPTALDFGPREIGMFNTLVTTIQNLGERQLTVTGLTVTGSADFGLHPAVPVPPFTVASGATVDVTVTYQPSAEGADAGALEIASDDPDEPVVSVALAGSGFAPVPVCDIFLTASSFDFGSVPLGGSVTQRAALVGNAGDAPCVVTALNRTGSADFAMVFPTPVTPFSVQPGLGRGIFVEYMPSELGPDNGMIEVVSDDPDEPGLLLGLSGTGVPAAPEINVNPLSLDYGTVTVGNTASLTMTIENLGTADLTVSALTLTGSSDFALGAGAPATPFVVPAGGSVGVPVDYTPSGTGGDSGQLDIASDDADEPSVEVSLTGTGEAAGGPQIDVSPLILDYGNVPVRNTATLTTTIKNVGTADLTVYDLKISGSRRFALGSGAPAVPFVVAPGASVDVPVDFTPTGTGQRNANLKIENDDADDSNEASINVTLQGTGV
jgi:hypothetical protein